MTLALALAGSRLAGSGDRRLPGFLLLSLLLHIAWLALPAARRAAPASVWRQPALAVHLAQPPAPEPTQVAGRDRPRTQNARRHEIAATADAKREPATPVHRDQGIQTHIDLETVFAAARMIAKDRTPNAAVKPESMPGVEAAVAKATRADVLVEERDAAGNWIHRIGGRRCVVAVLRIPFFMQGMAIPVQCEVSKQ